MTPALSIARLVIDLPGLAPAQGAELARLVGTQLADTGARGAFGTLRVRLDASAARRSPAQLAPLVVAALLRQIA